MISEVKLLIAVTGVYVCYLSFGIFQEKIYQFRGSKGEKFTYTNALLLVQCFINLIFALFGLILDRRSKKIPLSSVKKGRYVTIHKGIHDFSGTVYEHIEDGIILVGKEGVHIEIPFNSKMNEITYEVANASFPKYSISAFCYLLAMLCSNASLNYVAYPVLALAKSTKIIPVMLFGAIYLRKRYSWKQYVRVLLITAGIAVFNLYPSTTKKAANIETSTLGYILLATSLACDGIYGPVLDGLVEKYEVGTYQLMYGQNAWSVIYSLLFLIVTGQLIPSYKFITQYPELMKTILLLSFASAFGQNFIFFTMSNFNSFVTSIITTTRKFFTVLMSVFIFKHDLTGMQWCGVGMVFSGLLSELYEKYQKNKNVEKVKKD